MVLILTLFSAFEGIISYDVQNNSFQYLFEDFFLLRHQRKSMVPNLDVSSYDELSVNYRSNQSKVKWHDLTLVWLILFLEVKLI